MDMKKMEELRKYLMERAGRPAWPDDEDFMIYDYCGGNMDDAYYGGREDESIIMARELLEKFFGIIIKPGEEPQTVEEKA